MGVVGAAKAVRGIIGYIPASWKFDDKDAVTRLCPPQIIVNRPAREEYSKLDTRKFS
jgi:hypothetical protein